jgi:hypothetical protein
MVTRKVPGVGRPAGAAVGLMVNRRVNIGFSGFCILRTVGTDSNKTLQQ